jgi:hypothetical protein
VLLPWSCNPGTTRKSSGDAELRDLVSSAGDAGPTPAGDNENGTASRRCRITIARGAARDYLPPPLLDVVVTCGGSVTTVGNWSLPRRRKGMPSFIQSGMGAPVR